jgi:hypothetical protein
MFSSWKTVNGQSNYQKTGELLYRLGKNDAACREIKDKYCGALHLKFLIRIGFYKYYGAKHLLLPFVCQFCS